MEGHLEETFNEMEKTIERLRGDVASLQSQMLALQEGKGAKPVKFQDTPPMVRPKVKKEAGGIGDLEVPKVGLPDSEEAPDMAVPKAAPASAIADKPSPPPPPASAKEQARVPAGRSSVEKKAKKKKRKGEPDAFESFNQFSEDFKAGS
jgi:hypothetical protein